MNNIELTISDVAYGGNGVGRIDNCVYFVPGVLTGEKISAEITKRHKKYAEAELLEVLTPSPSRIPPVCQYSGICPGCAYQHTTYENEITIKQKQLRDLLQHIGHIDITDVLLPPKPAPNQLHYRNKITLHSQKDENGTALGYIGKDNKSIVDIAECPIAHPEINKKLEFLRSQNTFMESMETGKTVTLRYTENDGVIFWKNQKHTDQRVYENSILGKLRVPLTGFAQIYPAVADMLIQDVMQKIRAIEPEFVIDVYCGIGIFALAASSCGVNAILGIDSNKKAIRAAQRNSAKLGLDRIEFIAAQADRVIKNALTSVDMKRTTVILDPPRRGLSNKITSTLQNMKPADIIYISCSPDTLARDIKLLSNAGYAIKNTRIYDMFPRTAKFESITLLTQT